MSIGSLAIAPSDPNVIWAGTGETFVRSNISIGNGIYRSTDGGAAGSWEVQVENSDPSKVNTLLLTNPLAASYTDCGFASNDHWVPMGWYCNVIAVDPTDPDIDPQRPAVYYARVIEIPTPRWVAYDAFRFGVDIPEGAEVSHQERA